MNHSLQQLAMHCKKYCKEHGKLTLSTLSVAGALLTSHAALAGPVHAYFADEHNTTPTTPTGNRILEIDIDRMELVNSLDVPGLLGHHADNGFNSKIYGVPKESGFVNVVELSKDNNGTTSMTLARKVDLIHKPRSGDAYNKKFNVILMAAKNRPMGSFINVETDQVVGTLGENMDCTLTDGTRLLSHADANTIAAATKYQCDTGSHGGDQVSGHPYWLTPDYAAIVDRTNKQISVYRVWQDGAVLKNELVNNLPTRTSVHQIVPRDRTNLPLNQQAEFFAVEEGEHTTSTNNYSGGIPHALLKMRLTTNGLQLVQRMNLQRTQVLPKAKADRILNACISIYRSTFTQALTGPSSERERRYNALFQREGVTRSPDQDVNNDFPIDCFYPGIPGGHNADFAPNNKHLYVPMAGGAVAVVDVNRWKIANTIDIGIRSGPGHFCFSQKHDVALSSNHGFSSIFNASFNRSIRYINSERPIGYYWIRLPFTRQGLTSTYQAHTCYVDQSEDSYYNFFTDGGVFYKIDLSGVFNNPTNGSSALVVDSLVTGGIPIQGSYIDLDKIKNPSQQFKANNDTATSNGSAVDIDAIANDAGNGLTLSIVDTANHGTVTIVNGKARYKPNAGYSGQDEFWYAVNDASGNEDWALVTVTVTSVVTPTPLQAVADSASTSAGQTITIDLLANDLGTGLYLGWVQSDYATVVKNNNKIIYTPKAGFTGVDDFWYEVFDANGESAWANILVSVGNQSNVLKANNDTASVKAGNSVTINPLANDTGNQIRLTIVDSAWTGQTSKSGNQIVYQADASFVGSVEVWYAIEDAAGKEEWGMVTINISN